MTDNLEDALAQLTRAVRAAAVEPVSKSEGTVIFKEVIRGADGRITSVIETDKARGTVIRKTVSRDRDHRIDRITQTTEPLRAGLSYAASLRQVPVDAETLAELA